MQHIFLNIYKSLFPDFFMKCSKCGYESGENKKIEEFYLCSICKLFSPSDNIQEYLKEKLDWRALESFRKFGKKNLAGMQDKAKQGNVMSRAAFGYKIINKELIIDEESKLQAEKIFLDFLNETISLNQLAKRHGFSVNGIKKILKNFTYLGKVKFDGNISQGKHLSIISPEMFNKVQNKLELIERQNRKI